VDMLPLKKPIYLDTGFEGIGNLNENLNIRKPKKKRKKRKLNGGEKLGNRMISRERVKVEHAIGGLKRFKIVSTIFRGITHSMDRVVEIACGLWNFHVRKNAVKLAGHGV
jgi:DDE superfamily endonuclease